MRLKIELISTSNIILSVGYNEHIQALIYNLLDTVDADWLHESGFTFEKRSFKLFAFSWILEKGLYDKRNKLFTFPQKVSFFISSPVDWILSQIAINLIHNNNMCLKLGTNTVQPYSIEVMTQPLITTDNILVRALTPVEVHSTLLKADGAKKTYYYAPLEAEFSDLVNQNLKKKWQALYNNDCPYNIKITAKRPQSCHEKIIIFKDTVIKGWKGHFRLSGEPEFLQFALDAGLGSRNSQGFGMTEVIL